jgi:uncharacterized protein YidB (DUF937 family)
MSGMGVSPLMPPPPPPGGRETVKTAMQAAAAKLGLSDSDLQTQLQSGQSLADIASKQGVSKDDLVNSIADSLKSSTTPLPNGVDPTSLATKLVEGKGRAGGHHHHHGGGGGAKPVDPTTGSDTSSQNLQTLATSLGTDPTTLLQQLQTGGLKWSPSQSALAGGVLTDQYA